MKRLAKSAALLWMLAGAGAGAQDSPPGYAGVDLFRMPQVAAAELQAARLIAAGNPAAAAGILDQLARGYPQAARLLGYKAMIAAMQGRDEDAFAALSAAAAAGLDDLDERLSRPPLSRIADDPLVQALRAAAPAPKPAPEPPAPRRIDAGEALVDKTNTYWSGRDGRLIARFEMLTAMRRFQIRDGALEEPYKTLQSWVARGRAAGTVGDLYDNRDAGHSALARRMPTQMSHVVYSDAAKAAGLHYGLNTQILFDRVTIGNSSTAIERNMWRSQPRLALTTPEGALRLWQLYARNHIYVFPEHRDHDPRTPPAGATGNDARPGHGDLFPANTPYMLISQGSSGSDRPILEALRAILAALKPEVKTFLEERNMIAPTAQMIFRRGQQDIETDEDYLSPRAHPSVFDPARSQVGRMIAMANALELKEIPPVVRLQVEREGQTGAVPGLLGADGPADERLFDTPSAIARVWRGAGHERRYLVGTPDVKDPNGRPLRFFWIVTQGDAANVSITPLDDAATRAEIVIRWGGEAPEAARPDITSPRVDIAVIADNGEFSAPAFFSVLYPAHENRVYEPAPDGGMRLVSVDHVQPQRGPYVDPAVWPGRDWRDDLDYAADGRLLGWTRSRGEARERFTHDGLLVRETDEAGRPVSAEEVAYRIEPDGRGFPTMVASPTGALHAYRYDGPDDRFGERADKPG
ncbi:MAG: hypothetical protein ACK5MQ_06055 [Pikeienuella sp.]